VIAQLRVPDGTTEITQVAALLEDIDLTGVVITGDAAHAQHATAAHLTCERGFDHDCGTGAIGEFGGFRDGHHVGDPGVLQVVAQAGVLAEFFVSGEPREGQIAPPRALHRARSIMPMTCLGLVRKVRSSGMAACAHRSGSANQDFSGI
jgi:hypothetical protein